MHKLDYSGLMDRVVGPSCFIWKKNLAKACDKIGLLQFRLVRWLFSINNKNIENVNKIFQLHAYPKNTELKNYKAIWDEMCKRWKLQNKVMSLPEEQADQKLEKSPFREIFKARKKIPPLQVQQIQKQEAAKPQGRQKELRKKILKIREDEWHLRTVLMDKNLGRFTEYDLSKREIKVGDQLYQVISAEVDDFANSALPLASCGSAESREIILLDPKNSPLLQKKYQSFVVYLKNYLAEQNKDKLSPDEFLRFVCAFMDQKVFPIRSLNLEEKVENIIKEGQKNPQFLKIGKMPCLPIDHFIKEKVGVCRHHSLVAAYLVDKFIKENSECCDFKGKVQMMRDNIEGGAHVWVSLICDKGKTFILDTANNVKDDLQNPKFPRRLDFIGPNALKRQLAKAEKVRQKYLKELGPSLS